jgi:UrcA family protein
MNITNISNLVRTNATRMALILLASAPVAMAAEAGQAVELSDAANYQVVSFKDLNLNSTAGTATLYARIEHAAKQVCGVSDHVDLARLQLEQTCVKNAISKAVTQVGSPRLTGLYKVKTGNVDKQETTLAQAR